LRNVARGMARDISCFNSQLSSMEWGDKQITQEKQLHHVFTALSSSLAICHRYHQALKQIQDTMQQLVRT